MSTVQEYPPVHLSDEEMAIALDRLAGKDALTRVAYVNGWLAADVEQHAAGIASTVITRQALALFRANQYLNMGRRLADRGAGVITIELSRDGWTGALQLSIQHYAEDGSGDGYRLFGPKFNGSSETLHKRVLDERDAAEIRAYLDREFPEAHRPPAPSPESIHAAKEIVADIIAEVQQERGE